MLTQKELKETLRYDEETGKFFWKIKLSPTGLPGSVAGSVYSDGYRVISIRCVRYKAHRLVFLYVHGYFPENNLDHINRIKDDNRLSNLREVSAVCNARNCGNPKNNSSGVKGVYYSKKDKKWCASIKINGYVKYIGCFHDFSNAVCARLAVEQCVGWNGCDSSSPAFKYVKERRWRDESNL